ncbi:nicotinate mononucleotide-dependent phosphoribosyltransferase CobT [Leptolyngbya sp. FACHB-711]|uniref:nicotinate mononucleotide-dependent phosphoribosyltransferase CobT n=1 Tax=unclassified Leptolyngbya TaxID=2650499 RepID=UPI0016822892|nr:TIGR00303 family protein [Leptolyngbya sp. FACHB-711]MBD1851601.1 TIGR00303 family protein [Cyanobacteria bacterium FACHB-502]MBD2025355.1 TIGR00303 family protein [Leptolyngbya sp. FACHB-711]
MLRLYTQLSQTQAWIDRHKRKLPQFACVLGFTETGLIPGISAAGATPDDRQFTAIADAEFLYHGVQAQPKFPLPPLVAGASPTLITRAIVAKLQIPTLILNAGLPKPPTVPAIDLGGMPARCLTTGRAIDRAVVQHLFQQGLRWGEKLAAQNPAGYLILGECVVGGTTTALAVLTGLGWQAEGKINSSHSTCNHPQKWAIVQQGLDRWKTSTSSTPLTSPAPLIHPFAVIAGLGDPMQIVVAGMTIAASRTCGVLLAGGTQMLAVYALTQSIALAENLFWQPEQVVVGTTRWVAEDPTGDTVGLAALLEAPLLATSLSFANSRYAQLRIYEQGYVKEGVGAGGCAIAAHLFANWSQHQLLETIEFLMDEQRSIESFG